MRPPQIRLSLGMVALLLLPVSIAAVLLTSGQQGSLALATPVAAIVFFAGYAAFVERTLRERMAEQVTRIESDVRKRLSLLDMADAATALSNFSRRLEQEVKRSQRYKVPLSIIVMRLRVEGDDLLSEQRTLTAHVVSTAASVLRTEDVLGYLGGFEYAFCLPHTDRAGAEVVLRRLNQAFEASAPSAGLASLVAGIMANADSMLGVARQDALRRSVSAVRSETWNELRDVA